MYYANVSWIMWFSSIIGGARNISWIHVTARHITTTSFRRFFPQGDIVSLHTYVDHCSAEYSRVTLCRSLEFSICATLSSPVFCPMNPSYLHLPGLSTMSLLLSQIASSTFGSPFLHHDPWALHTVIWDSHRSPHLFAWCLVSYIQLFHIFCSFQLFYVER